MTKAIDRSPNGVRRAARLSQRLRGDTKTLHAAAERSGVMRRLAHGELLQSEYVALLENLAEIYRALESELERNHEHPALHWLPLDAVARLGAIQRDIDVLGATAARRCIVPATDEYVARIRRAGAVAPDLLIAHAYVRYLGDLSGGRILAPIVARCFGRDGRDVTAFYDFALIPDAAAFKRTFRNQLDRVTDGAVSDGIVEEAKAAFALHERIFRELENSVPTN
jgi:heme oxygenase